MSIIYLATSIVGTKSRVLFQISENGGIALAQVAEYYLKKPGLIILAITIGLACLKTAIGLVICFGLKRQFIFINYLLEFSLVFINFFMF